jgi:hypothetical protein
VVGLPFAAFGAADSDVTCRSQTIVPALGQPFIPAGPLTLDNVMSEQALLTAGMYIVAPAANIPSNREERLMKDSTL